MGIVGQIKVSAGPGQDVLVGGGGESGTTETTFSLVLVGNVRVIVVCRTSVGVIFRETPDRLGQGHLLVGGVGPEVTAPQAHDEVVPHHVVRRGRRRPVGIVVAVFVPGGARVPRPVTTGQRPSLVVPVVDKTGGEPKVLEGLSRQLHLVVVSFRLKLVLSVEFIADEKVDFSLAGEVFRKNGAEEPEAVLEDVSAQVEACLDSVPLVLSVQILVVHVLGDGVVVGADPESIPLLALHPTGAVVPDQLSVEGVAAGTGDDTDDAPHGAAVLGLVTGGLDLNLFDHLEGGALRGLTGVESRRVHAVDIEHVLRPGGAVDGGSAQPGLHVDTGDGGDQGLKVSSLRKGGEDLFGQDAAAGGALCVDQGHLGGNNDLFAQLSELHLHVDSESLLHMQDNVLFGDRGKAFQGEGDLVGSRRDPQEPILAVLVGDRGGRSHHGGA